MGAEQVIEERFIVARVLVRLGKPRVIIGGPLLSCSLMLHDDWTQIDTLVLRAASAQTHAWSVAEHVEL